MEGQELKCLWCYETWSLPRAYVADRRGMLEPIPTLCNGCIRKVRQHRRQECEKMLRSQRKKEAARSTTLTMRNDTPKGDTIDELLELDSTPPDL